MSYKWPGIPNGDYSFDHGRAVWNKIINYLRRLSEKLDSDIVDATADRRGMMTAADKDKLDGVEPGAEVNQNAFSGVKVGSSTIEADSKTDVVELVAGTGIELTIDTTNDKVTIGGKEATTTAAGLMSATDKSKLDGIAAGAEVNQNAFSNVKVGPAIVAADSKTDTITLGVGAGVIISANTTNDSITIGCVEASQSVPGIMSTADKIKLDGITSGAEPNQNAFAIVKVGATSVTADTKQDTLNLVEGTGITISPNATTDTVTISVTDNTYAAYSHTHEYLPLSGGTMAGAITRKTNAVRGTAPLATIENYIHATVDSNNTRYGLIETVYRTDKSSETLIYAYNTTVATGNNIGRLAIGCDENGNVYTVAPTPSVTDDSSKIATTAYVKNCVPISIGSATQPVYVNANGVVSACNNTNLASTLCNALSTASATPQDDTYYISQDISGGTSYYRRPVSALYTYIKNKLDLVYLKLSGGTVTGNILMDYAHFYNARDNDELQVHGGTGWSKGATLALHGYDKNVNTGVFALYADAGNGAYFLRGTPSGDLTWKNPSDTSSDTNDVAVVSKFSAASYYIRFSNGLQLCAGSISITATGTAKTYPVPFSEAPRVFFTPSPGSANTDVVSVRAYPRSATGFTAYMNKDNAHVAGNAHWFAYGRWK